MVSVKHFMLCPSGYETGWSKHSLISAWRQHPALQQKKVSHCLQGDVKKLVDDVGAFKPSLFVAVPRVLDRMKSGIEAKVGRSGPIASTIFKLAVWYKRIWIKLGFLHNVSWSKMRCSRATALCRSRLPLDSQWHKSLLVQRWLSWRV